MGLKLMVATTLRSICAVPISMVRELHGQIVNVSKSIGKLFYEFEGTRELDNPVFREY